MRATSDAGYTRWPILIPLFLVGTTSLVLGIETLRLFATSLENHAIFFRAFFVSLCFEINDLSVDLRTITSDRTLYSKFVAFLFRTRRYWNYREAMNLLFALPGLYSNIPKTEEILQFRDKKFPMCVATSFERKRLMINKELFSWLIKKNFLFRNDLIRTNCRLQI